MLVIRFLRTGKKNQPFFRVVLTDKKNPPKGGRFLEILGFFNPLTKENKLSEERIKYWLSVGAQTSARVHNLLISKKIIKGKKKDVHVAKKSDKTAKGETTQQKSSSAQVVGETEKAKKKDILPQKPQKDDKKKSSQSLPK